MELSPREKDKLLILTARWSPNVAGPAVRNSHPAVVAFISAAFKTTSPLNPGKME